MASKKVWMMPLYVALFAAPSLLSAGSAGRQAAAEREVMSAFDLYVKGWHDGSVEQLSAVYTHDEHLSAFWPDPAIGTRLEGWTQVHADLSDLFSHIKGMDLDFHDRQIDLYGTCAVLTTLWTWNHPWDETYAHGRATFVFAKQDGKWRMVHEHSSVMPFDRETLEKRK